MSNRIDRLEARAQALSIRVTEPLLDVPTVDGITRMTIAQFNAAGGILALGPCWKNPDQMNLRAARKLLDAVPSAIE